MSKKLLFLNGISILAVICNHAAIYGGIMISWLTGEPFTASNCVGGWAWTYWGLTAIEKLAVFSVPAFLFVSGFFASYSVRGGLSGQSWKIVRVRLVNLLIPYTIWSIVVFVLDALVLGEVLTPARYLLRLASGRASQGYYFVPLLCQFYVLAPVIVSLAKTRGRLMLSVSGFLQLLLIGVTYWLGSSPGFEGSVLCRVVGLPWFFRWGFFFVLGVVFATNTGRLQNLARLRWALLAGVVVLAPLATIESELLYASTGDGLWRVTPLTLFSSLYALAFILCYLTFNPAQGWVSRAFVWLSKRVYGIYLLQWAVLTHAARCIALTIPGVIPYQVLVQPVLIAVGLGVPLAAMGLVAGTPARRYYRWLFG